MALFGNRAIEARIDGAIKIIENMAAGDFTSPVDTSGSDVVVPLVRALKKCQMSLGRRSPQGSDEPVSRDTGSRELE